MASLFTYTFGQIYPSSKDTNFQQHISAHSALAICATENSSLVANGRSSEFGNVYVMPESIKHGFKKQALHIANRNVCCEVSCENFQQSC